jgi:hypothetical protein
MGANDKIDANAVLIRDGSDALRQWIDAPHTRAAKASSGPEKQRLEPRCVDPASPGIVGSVGIFV